MKTIPKYFIAVYTNEVKEYCDKKFFKRINKIARGNPVHVVDNSNDETYNNKLSILFKDLKNFNSYYLQVERDPEDSLFHRRVTESVLLLREKFLESDLPYFLIIESDVLPPRSLLKKFERSISKLETLDNTWGIVGALYHLDFHTYGFKGLQKTYHVLSGCAVYKKSLIEKYPFRWSRENIRAFPDAWICLDSKKEYGLYDDHRIKCLHMENPKTGTRYSKAL